MIEHMKKTRLCQEFMNTGSCKYGDRCTFAVGTTPHTGAARAPVHGCPLPTHGLGDFNTAVNLRLITDPTLCSCGLQHGQQELRQAPVGPPAPVQQVLVMQS